MTPLERRATLDAMRLLSEGRSVGIGSRSFWSAYGYPRTSVRSDILSRANTLLSGASQAVTGGWSGSIESLFADTPYSVEPGAGGPADTDNPVAYARLRFYDSTGAIIYRSWRETFSWSSPLADVQSAIEDAVSTMAQGYGISVIDDDNLMDSLEPGSLLIY